jgi:hypothetical protein
MSSNRRVRNPRVGAEGDVVVKRMTIPSLALASNAAGTIVPTDYVTGLVQSTPASEWASFAARYQQCRIRSIKVTMDPVFTVSYAGIPHSQLYAADFIGTAAPGSVAQVLSDERALVFGTSRRVVYTSNWSRNPNARLWNPTSAAIPAANQFGIAVASVPATLANSLNYFILSLEFIVEFRGSQ